MPGAALGRLSVRHLFVMVPVLGVVVAAGRALTDNSFLWHVRAGSLQLDAGEVLRADPFSFTAAGESWRTQSWIADLGYGLLERWTGDLSWVWPLITLTMVATVALMGVAIYQQARRPIVTAVGLLVMTWLLLRTLVPRPVVFSHLLLAALIVALSRPRLRWTIPLVVWVWAGVHGSFVIGLGLIGLEAIRSQRRDLWEALGLSVLAASLTAHGPALWGILTEFIASRGALDLITEWAPPDLADLGVAPYGLLIAGVLVAAARGRLAPRDLVVVVPFLLFGLTSYRALIPATLVLAPWAIRAVDLPELARRQESYLINGGIAVTLVFVAVWAGAVRAQSTPHPERFPVAAISALESGPVFHGDAVGGYLIYESWPDVLVFIDDRAELYGTERFVDFVGARAGEPVWRDVFQEYGIRQALLEADTTGLQEVLVAVGWTEQYRDESFVVLAGR